MFVVFLSEKNSRPRPPVINFIDQEIAPQKQEENSGVGGFVKNLFGASKVDLNAVCTLITLSFFRVFFN